MTSGAGPRAVIVGAGPSGFYTADQLLSGGIVVDMLDALPTPFGLVRAGVAPDHPKIKAVTRVFEKTAGKEGFRFFGGLVLGRDVTRAELLERYDIVVYALGSSGDGRLGIPGEDRPGSHAATQFVAWYNGHPDAADYKFDLSARRVVVIGNGNVAIDVARMLVLHPDELSSTDAADHALKALAGSRARDVVLLGRRGPAQAAFTPPELGELAHLKRAGVEVDAGDLELDGHSARWLEETAPPTARRNLDLLRQYAAAGPKEAPCRIVLRFLCSPVEILGDGEHGPVTGVRLARNELQPADGGLRAVATGREEIIDASLVLRSVGYRGKPVAGLPFDDRRGVIRNMGGRVCDDWGCPHRGEYVVGWIKRGPSGVIGTNKKDAADTVARIIEDRGASRLNRPSVSDPGEIAAFYAARVPDGVTWAGWRAIDAYERSAGAPYGRPRIKVVRMAELLAYAREAPAV